MKITVRIEDIEVVIDRSDYKEVTMVGQETQAMNNTIIPTIQEAAKQVKELYKLKNENKDFI